MYARMAQFYDRIYAFKDYKDESTKIVRWISQFKRSAGMRLLDVACGTGCHLQFLAETFAAEGLDQSQELLKFARQRNPQLTFHCADMRTFRLPATYDAITCLFSSIGYMTTIEDLEQAIATMAEHLSLGGILMVEPWLTPEAWKPGSVHGMYIDEPDLKIARINTSQTQGRLSVFDLHHLVGTPEETFHFVEHHEMGLYTMDEMVAAFDNAQLETTVDDEGLTGRGMVIGVKQHG